jgi:hypothetical protein
MRHLGRALGISWVVALAALSACSSSDSASTDGATTGSGGSASGGAPGSGTGGAGGIAAGTGGTAGAGASDLGGFGGVESVGCKNDGTCDADDDCVCADCDKDFLTCSPTLCDHNGTCDKFVEGCSCDDCAMDPECADNASSCMGGAPNKTCDANEPCSCPDCATQIQCIVPNCTNDQMCDLTAEDCICADCKTDSTCSDPTNCTDDGFCDAFIEGCQCADCVSASSCK